MQIVVWVGRGYVGVSWYLFTSYILAGEARLGVNAKCASLGHRFPVEYGTYFSTEKRESVRNVSIVINRICY